MRKILEAEHLTKEYRMGGNTTQTVLDDISMSIAEGEFISVMGPSGSGKSTLLYSISGMDRATSGNITFSGKNLSEMTEDELSKIRLRRMGFVFQQSNLLKNLNILDNIILSAYLARKETKEEILKRAGQLMEETGISQLADNDITQASGGQLQRASICRALINQPEILFGDEPTGALNSRAAGEVMDIFLHFNQRGSTILLVTHDARVAARTERVLFMLDGKIAGEKRMGKFQPAKQDLKLREQKLAQWLSELGF